MDIKELISFIRTEERERCLNAILNTEPSECAKEFVLPGGKREIGWKVPGIQRALGIQ